MTLSKLSSNLGANRLFAGVGASGGKGAVEVHYAPTLDHSHPSFSCLINLKQQVIAF
jgi:hypothetical protein